MADTTLTTIDDLLAGAIEAVDDPETTYMLRSARQLLQVVQRRHDDVDEAIAEAVEDEDVIENLRALGYVE